MSFRSLQSKLKVCAKAWEDTTYIHSICRILCLLDIRTCVLTADMWLTCTCLSVSKEHWCHMYYRWSSGCSRCSAITSGCIKSPAVSSDRPAAAAASQGGDDAWPSADCIYRSSVHHRTYSCTSRRIHVTRRFDVVHEAALASATTRRRHGDRLYVELLKYQHPRLYTYLEFSWQWCSVQSLYLILS